jgi:hypothetical protein
MGLSIHFYSTKIVNSKRKGATSNKLKIQMDRHAVCYLMEPSHFSGRMKYLVLHGDTSVTGSVGWMIRKLSIRTK